VAVPPMMCALWYSFVIIHFVVFAVLFSAATLIDGANTKKPQKFK
jgi:hypothetical protein